MALFESFKRASDQACKRFLHIQSVVEKYPVELTSRHVIQLHEFRCELDTHLNRFRTAEQKMYEQIPLPETHDPDAADKLSNDAQDLYIMIKAIIMDRLPENPPTPNPNTTASMAPFNSSFFFPSSSHAKLPTLNIEKFDGTKLEEWAAWRGAYEAGVHNNQALDPVVKLQYLRSYLRGGALQLISTLPVLGPSYMTAWSTICAAYQNTRLLVTHHVSQMLDMPSVSSNSEVQITRLATDIRHHMAALRGLKYAVSNENCFLVTILLRKMDDDLRELFEDFRGADEQDNFPKISEVLDFLTERSRKLINSKLDTSRPKSLRTAYKPSEFRTPAQHAPGPSTASTLRTKQPSTGGMKCAYCSEGHPTYLCERFVKLSVQERVAAVKEKRLCFNCFSPSHGSAQCPSTKRCRHCQQSHHSLLHLQRANNLVVAVNQQPNPPTPETQPDQADNQLSEATANTLTTFVNNQKARRTTVLPSATLVISSSKGVRATVRALLDTCAQRTLITAECAQSLKLKTEKADDVIAGVGQQALKLKGQVYINVWGPQNTVIVENQPALVVSRLTGNAPSCRLAPRVREAAAKYKLADPRFDQPDRVDMLVGADLLPHLLTGEMVFFGPSMPVGMGTIFGIAIYGTAPCEGENGPPTNLLTVLLAPTSAPSPNSTPPSAPRPPPTPSNTQLSAQLQRLWELEEPQAVTTPVTPEEEAAEEFYKRTTVQQPNKRYMVRLPFRPNHPPLGRSKYPAENRQYSLENKFNRNPPYHKAYVKFMADYRSEGFMAPAAPPDDASRYFLPHHGVVKSSSSTTKLRVVFDASAPTSNGVSLNNILLPGPKLQNDIRNILINFRRHAIVFSADIRQMFLQIDLHPADRRYQSILWRESKEDRLKIYELTTVTFGINCSPFLAMRSVQQTRIDHGHLHELGSQVLEEDTYVDDICSGADTLPLASAKLDDTLDLLEEGGFRARKITSNHPKILERFPVEDLELPSLDDPEAPAFKILGLKWLSTQDVFTYSVKIPPPAATKRGLLSAISTIFDPLGLIAPTVFLLKSFVQELWRTGLGWDTPLPEDIRRRWENFLVQLPRLEDVKIPRLLKKPDATSFQVHGFCDASQLGYCGMLYLRSADSASANVSLIIAKTKVAPTQQITVPRLELCAAVLLTKLLSAHLPQLKRHYDVERIICWSDSTNVLSWIRLPPYTLKTFVANRVTKIQELSGEVEWKHVRTRDNPADHGSRGVPPSEMAKLQEWFEGPSWLSEPPENWPIPPESAPPEEELELRPPTSVLVVTINEAVLPPFKFFWKTIKALGRIVRYTNNLRARAQLRKQADAEEKILAPLELWKRGEPLPSPLSVEELAKAEVWLWRSVQRLLFPEDLDRLARGQRCTSRLQALTPFIDPVDGLLRVGGRLKNSDLEPGAKHPILLSSEHQSVRQLIRYEHWESFHTAPQALQTRLAQKYWILAARRSVRSCFRQCRPCFRYEPKNNIPLMGNLPAPRTTPSPPFTHTGVDLCGPFKVKIHQLRSARILTVLLCIFVCFSTKAVHLEVVHDLTALAFTAALKRFASRRSCPSDIYADRGTNFVGSSNEIIRTEDIVDPEDPTLLEFSQKNRLRFHFNPASAPFQGGIWERAVRSAKQHIKRTLGDTVLILEEFQTLCCRVEAMLNSRPITPLPSSPNDPQPLTPGHFLIGRPLTAVPEALHDDSDMPVHRRWLMVDALSQRIWKRWSSEYLHLLQPRNKWTAETPPLKEGDIVLIEDEDLPTLSWRMGRILAVHPGNDGVVRVATVRAGKSKLMRPVHKLYPFPPPQDAERP